MNKKWHRRHMELAETVASWSKDPSTKVGAVAIADNRQILSMGYNGFPRGIEDTFTRLHDRKDKYKYVVHAEMNCIYNATHNGISLNGAHLYVWGTNGIPICSECAKGIIQVGIKAVYMPKSEFVAENWITSFEHTKRMFEEVGITITTVGI